jgi:Fe-S-cluster containining protein
MPSSLKNKALEENRMFSCKKCGACCQGYGGTYVTGANIQEIAAYIGVDADAFVKNFCSLSGGKPVLAQQANGFCIFWDEVCTIHPVKPRMCREWPFIRSVLTDAANWHIMAASCPGIQKNVSMDQVQSHIRRLHAGTS